jgi:hypothetical protein
VSSVYINFLTCKPMKTDAINHSADACRAATKPQQFQPLEQVTRPTVPTEQAAYYLDRRPQTLRTWAMRDGSGAIRPLRINGRLAWPVAELKRVLGLSCGDQDRPAKRQPAQ